MSSWNNAFDKSLVGLHKIGFDVAATEEEITAYTLQMLAYYLNANNVVAFVGSGISNAYGYPTWNKFAKDMVDFTLWCSGEDVENIQDVDKALLDGRERPCSVELIGGEKDILEKFSKDINKTSFANIRINEWNEILDDLCERYYEKNNDEDKKSKFKKRMMEIVTNNSSEQNGDKLMAEMILKLFHESPRSSKLSSEDQKLVILDLCEVIFARNENDGNTHRKEFRAQIAKIFQKKEKKDSKDRDLDPLRKVIELLGIRRFITTNYDSEIENAFERVLGYKIQNSEAEESDLAESKGTKAPLPAKNNKRENNNSKAVLPNVRSLVFDPENAEALIQFAVAAPGFEQGVLHIHGKVASGNMVVTERDYQHVYLQDIERHHQTYREALKIIFEGNAILFLGFGLQEADLLRPLRQFAAEKAHSGYERPLFALLPDPGEEQRMEWRRYLYARFAVKVLFYSATPSDSATHSDSDKSIAAERAKKVVQERTKALCNALDQLKKEWQEWWEDWKKKPLVRKPEFTVMGSEKNCMMRHAEKIEEYSSTKTKKNSFRNADPQGYSDWHRDFLKNAHAGRPVIFLGRPGTGKGTIAQRLIWDESKEAAKKGKKDKKFFFATAHFTNDLLSIIDAAASFFLGDQPQGISEKKSPLDRLKQALEKGEHVLAIGGLERLLVPTEVSENDQTASVKPIPRRRADDQKLEENQKQLDDWMLTFPNGRPVSYEVKRFLELVNNATNNFKSIIALTSSIWPIGLDRSKVTCFKLEGIPQEKIQECFKECFDGSGNADDAISRLIKELHNAVNGHCYALSVIHKTLLSLKKDGALQNEEVLRIKKFVGTVTAMDMDARPTKAIELALDVMDNKKDDVILKSLVQRIALFSTPISIDEVYASYSKDKYYPSLWKKIKGRIRKLEKANIIIRCIGDRITAHTLVRNYVLEELGDMPLATGEAQRFDLTGWSGGAPETLAARGKSHYLTSNSIDALLKEIKVPEEKLNKIEELEKKSKKIDELNEQLKESEESKWKLNKVDEIKGKLSKIEELKEQLKESEKEKEALQAEVKEFKRKQQVLIRAAFGMIRSRWTATAIPRLHKMDGPTKKKDLSISRAHYDDYQKRLFMLMNTIRHSSRPGDLWLEESTERSKIETDAGHLYADELAWLCNEQAQVAFCQGFVEDAKALLLHTNQMINSVAERGTHGYRWCESEIALGLVQMEMGHLTIARQHLANALHTAQESLGDLELAARARGHLALVLHLQGHFGDAQTLYGDAIDYLSKAAADNLRAISIFRRHRGDLWRRLEKWDDAKDDLQQSLTAAQSGRYPDLVHYTYVAQMNFELARDEKAAMGNVGLVFVENLASTLDFARHVGIPRLEWEAQNVQAKIALKQGEFELAEKLSVSNLAIASALGLKLRLTNSLHLAGDVAAKRGNHRAARNFFHSVHELAERQRYQLLIDEAERHLRAEQPLD